MIIKDASLKNALNRGFTLIELMIVIVILGVLMGTILPRLTGAQARARDTGRIADLNTIAQALETYYDDFGSYPGAAGTGYCLEDVADNPARDLLGYLKGGKIPVPPAANQSTSLLGMAGPCVGKYYYASLENRGLDKNGYILATDMETYQKANVDENDLPDALDANTKVSDISADITENLNDLKAADEVDATDTLYILVN